jgi:catechol 2,3-dioxygenase-like lactoylglutathione lyase family enzyme
MDMKLEVLVLPVSDVDRAKTFYEKLGFRQDIDYATPDGKFRVIQFTPPKSEASIIFGKGITTGRPGSYNHIMLAVDDVEAARKDLTARGIKVSDVFHYAAGPLNNASENPHVPGGDPEHRSYYSFASFEDPDGNGWLLQEIQTRLPGREWKPAADVETLSQLLLETGQQHHHYEITHEKHDWWDWYAPYLKARQDGSSQSEAVAAADRHMDEVHHIPALAKP